MIIDDVDKDSKWMGTSLKHWMDHRPFMAPVKGGYMEIRPKSIIVTSNYMPDEIWEEEMVWKAIQRRLKVKKFTLPLF